VTTNAILLGAKIDDLYEAGLRNITIGYYGTGSKYDSYVQRKQRFAELEKSVAEVRARYGTDIGMRINWLLMKPSCSVEDLGAAVDFARTYDLTMQIDLIHYSLPYFTDGPDGELQFTPDDLPEIQEVVDELVRLKRETPALLNQSEEGLRSIPHWLIKGPDMRVACDSYQMLWVGPDGTVQQCYVTFRLGNLHEGRLSEMLDTATHRQAARDAFAVNCPNCHCHYDRRIQKQPGAAAQPISSLRPVAAPMPLATSGSMPFST
jgi:cyclic pyranopterin phosphate synthase